MPDMHPTPETLRLYADILERPYRDTSGQMRPAVEINLVAAKALRFQADAYEQNTGKEKP